MSEQPPPRRDADAVEVWPSVIADTHNEAQVREFLARDQLGRERYGTPLTVWNGRDALRDAREELVDFIAYVEQCRLRVPESTKEWDPYHPRDVLGSLRREAQGMLATLETLTPYVPKEKP